MTDDDPRLRQALRSMALPGAPDALRGRLRAVAISEGTTRVAGGNAGRRGARLFLAVAILALLAASILVLVAGRNPTLPISVDGLPVMTVSEALAAHTAGTLPDSRAAVRGWWSNGSIGHSCAPSFDPVGELELYCHDGEYGIAETDEPMYVVDLGSGLVTHEAQGPHLTPYVPEGIDGIDRLFALPRINGQQFPPVPIVVIGHFDDPRADQCRPSARQLCRDRLVLERIAAFDIGSVATPGVTAPPTAFPDPPPAPLFEASACAGDVPYAFVGWTTTAELEMPYDRPGHVFAMVTKDPVLLTEDGWVDDPNGSGHQFQVWGPKICIAEEGPGHEGEMGFGSVPADTYVLWDDGLRTSGSDPVRPPGSS